MIDASSQVIRCQPTVRWGIEPLIGLNMSKKFIALTALSLASTSAHGAVTYEIVNGRLAAIRGIIGNPNASSDIYDDTSSYSFDYNGVRYSTFTDIIFEDGTCSAVFGVCDRPITNTTRTRRLPVFLSAFLKDNVVVDGKAYNFLSDGSSIRGCNADGICSIYAGVTFEPGQNYAFSSQIASPNGIVTSAVPRDIATLDTTNANDKTFARFEVYSKAISPVPEPATWAMMLLGLGMVAAAARYRRRSTTTSYA